jgi:glycosyltransferase involved in cell wall biosynthesis
LKVVFVSSYLNHHQLQLCLEFFQILGNDFIFIATKKIKSERIKLGYKDISNDYGFTLNAYENKYNFHKAILLSSNCEILINGSSSNLFVRERLNKNKLTFTYSERVFKKGFFDLKNIFRIIKIFFFHTKYRNKKLYLLAASAYATKDYNLFGAYKGKSFKWGYFPLLNSISQSMTFDKKVINKKKRLLWVGRLIKLKHPEHAVIAAKKLKEEGFDFELNIIGEGYLKKKLLKLINKFNLSDCVHMLGAMSPSNVQNYMYESDIFLFTSDYNEGWGAVLNEAMVNGCAVIASDAIGSVPFLLKNKVNGLIYTFRNQSEMYSHLKNLLLNNYLITFLGNNAHSTITKLWNAKNAVNRFVKVSDLLLNNRIYYYSDGPFSKG